MMLINLMDIIIFESKIVFESIESINESILYKININITLDI